MIYLDNRMRELLYGAMGDGCTCLLGTATADGKPQISMKGSVMVFDRTTLAYWERAKRSALENVAANPNVVSLLPQLGPAVNLAIPRSGGGLRDRGHPQQRNVPHGAGRTGPRPGTAGGGRAGKN